MTLQRALNAALQTLRDAWAAKHAYTRWQASDDHRRQARDYLAKARLAVDWCKEAIGTITAPSPELQQALQERVQTILGRFSLVDGFLPFTLSPDDIDRTGAGTDRRIYRVKTADGRELRQFSTGQRAQVAVSLLTAQNLAIPHKLCHRIILLDDVTTAYDLSIQSYPGGHPVAATGLRWQRR